MMLKSVHQRLILTIILSFLLNFMIAKVCASYWTAPSWLHVPTDTTWSMNHEIRIPFGKSSISLSLPVKYKFNNESILDVDSAGRSLNDEQEDIFNTIENTLRSFGLDGKSCLLKAICEMNEKNTTRDLTIFGEILTLILTPRRTFRERSFLIEYLRAEDVGRQQKGNCWKHYNSCPFSIKHFLSRMQYVR